MKKSAITANLSILVVIMLLGCSEAMALDPPSFTDDPDPPGDIPNAPRERQPSIGFDIAENGSHFVANDGSGLEDRLPVNGGSFVAQGYLYPFGFLDDLEGTNSDGSPAHPDMVVGLWTSHGYFMGDANTDSDRSIVSTQIFDFFQTPGYEPGKGGGRHIVVSDGYESADSHWPVARVITGASGQAANARGELFLMLLGSNDSGGADLRFSIQRGFKPIISTDDVPLVWPSTGDRCTWDFVDGLVCED